MIMLAEYLGVGLGFLYLLLAIREYRGCWIAGAAASVLFGAVFWEAGLPMQALLQIYYVAVAVHGWWHWGPGHDKGAPVPHRVSARTHGLVIAALIGATVVTTMLVRNEPGSLQAWGDSLSSWAGVVATWMVARKVLEAWLYWVVIDVGTAGLYFHAGLLASSALYVVYAILAVIAWREWKAHYLRLSSS